MNKTNKNKQDTNTRKKLAKELRDAFGVLSPFIEKHTSIVCPDCTDLCCKDRHGRYDENDILFLSSLGSYMPQDHQGREEDGPCRYMVETGCTLERWMRPYRCTFFFCSPLLNSLEADSALSRCFRIYLEQLVSIRKKLLE